jgi:hypothetical protein
MSKFIIKKTDAELLKSKITDNLIHKIRMEYTRYEVEPAPENSRDLSEESVTK